MYENEQFESQISQWRLLVNIQCKQITIKNNWGYADVIYYLLWAFLNIDFLKLFMWHCYCHLTILAITSSTGVCKMTEQDEG